MYIAHACITLQVSFEGDIPELEYEPNLDDILNDVRMTSSPLESNSISL